MDLTMQELEAAINYWRAVSPARGHEFALSPEVGVLATIYAQMIYRGAKTVAPDSLSMTAQQLLQTWRQRCSGHDP